MAKKLRTQPRVPGRRRRQLSTAVSSKIERWIEGERRHFNVGRSFVIAVACAQAAGIKLEDDEDYHG